LFRRNAILLKETSINFEFRQERNIAFDLSVMLCVMVPGFVPNGTQELSFSVFIDIRLLTEPAFIKDDSDFFSIVLLSIVPRSVGTRSNKKKHKLILS
jgi:hypothetical protein